MERIGAPSSSVSLIVRLVAPETALTRRYEVSVSGNHWGDNPWSFDINWPGCGPQSRQGASVFGNLVLAASAVQGHLEALTAEQSDATSYDLLKSIGVDNLDQILMAEKREQEHDEQQKAEQAVREAEWAAHVASGKCQALLEGFGKGRCQHPGKFVVKYADGTAAAKTHPDWRSRLCGTHMRPFLEDPYYTEV